MPAILRTIHGIVRGLTVTACNLAGILIQAHLFRFSTVLPAQALLWGTAMQGDMTHLRHGQS